MYGKEINDFDQPLLIHRPKVETKNQKKSVFANSRNVFIN